MRLQAGLIGSCTNSSYEDMQRAASVARQALKAGIKSKVPFTITPGSEQIRATIERDGLMDVFTQVRAAGGGWGLLHGCWVCCAAGQQDTDVAAYNARSAGGVRAWIHLHQPLLLGSSVWVIRQEFIGSCWDVPVLAVACRQ
jgi:aconitase A